MGSRFGVQMRMLGTFFAKTLARSRRASSRSDINGISIAIARGFGRVETTVAMFLGCTVVSPVTRAKSFVRNAPLSCATRKLSARRSSTLSPSRLHQWLRSVVAIQRRSRSAEVLDPNASRSGTGHRGTIASHIGLQPRFCATVGGCGKPPRSPLRLLH